MCAKKSCGCQKPERLKRKPEDCTPEQVEECHGRAGKHPCVQAAKKG